MAAFKYIVLLCFWFTCVSSIHPTYLTQDEAIRYYFLEGYSYRLILCFLIAAHGVVISMSTLKRNLRRQGLRRRGYYSSIYHVGDSLLMELNQSGSLLGYRAMHRRLRRKYGILIPRKVIREMLVAVDPASVQLRCRHRLIRRNYNIKGPNYCWHIDGYDKLKTYGFAIHGCIDGFSRKVLWLEVSKTNNDSSVIAGYYLRAVEKYGCPRIVRGDRGTENSRIAYLQPFLRRNGQDSLAEDGSFQYGRSSSNQRIEAWWSQLRKWCTDWWIHFFHMLKEEGHFDETNPIHVDCIRFAFMDIIEMELNEVCDMWNNHLIAYTRRGNIDGIPEELYYLSEMRGYENYACGTDSQDVAYCWNYATTKPSPVPDEFVQLAGILMHENNWYMPRNCNEAITLYFDLLQCIIPE